MDLLVLAYIDDHRRRHALAARAEPPVRVPRARRAGRLRRRRSA
ncbi:MAG TPA: hypothetical protein VFZ77_16685 [Acidimicrobiales bacterium]